MGRNGTLLRSTNYGSSWIPQNSGTSKDLQAIKMMDNAGYIVGSNGLILKTTNGGIIWTHQVSGTNEDLNFGYFSGGNTGWIVGSGGTILRTSNGGTKWIKQHRVPNITLNSIKMSGEIGWTIGDAGTFLKRRLDSIYLPYKQFIPNNIGTYIWYTGIFNQSPVSNQPGFEWPAGSGETYVFTTGINVAGYYNNQLRMASASYLGESMIGYCENGVFHCDNRFKIYRYEESTVI